MDDDVRVLISTLCTRAAMLMEDSSVIALGIASVDAVQVQSRLEELEHATTIRSGLAPEASVAMSRNSAIHGAHQLAPNIRIVRLAAPSFAGPACVSACPKLDVIAAANIATLMDRRNMRP